MNFRDELSEKLKSSTNDQQAKVDLLVNREMDGANPNTSDAQYAKMLSTATKNDILVYAYNAGVKVSNGKKPIMIKQLADGIIERDKAYKAVK